MKTLNVDWSDFFDEYKPVKNHIDDNSALEGAMFETYGEEIQHVMEVLNVAPDRVWTVIDSEDEPVITNGFHYVNRLGYIITEKPAIADCFYEVV